MASPRDGAAPRPAQPEGPQNPNAATSDTGQRTQPVHPPRPNCDDCGATNTADGHLRHRAPCPTAEAIDDVTAREVAWFAAHPAAPYRWRALHLAEYAELLTAGVDLGGRWRAHVQRHPAGIRRSLCRDGVRVLVVVDVVEARWSA